MKARPPRDNVVRAMPGVRALELRAEGDTGPVMTGHFAVFDQWTEIDSWIEGRFLERIAPGAFRQTFGIKGPDGDGSIRVLFQHGSDPVVGDKPIATPEVLIEDQRGVYYEAPLLDAPYVRDNVIPGLRAKLFGASFRFRVIKEDLVDDPKKSDFNPQGLPERTIREAAVYEFGPVTFPAYPGASAGMRSMTDSWTLARLAPDDEQRKALIALLMQDTGTEAEPHSQEPAVAIPESVIATPVYPRITREQFLAQLRKGKR
jgi:HK97 family phage prohead protease